MGGDDHGIKLEHPFDFRELLDGPIGDTATVPAAPKPAVPPEMPDDEGTVPAGDAGTAGMAAVEAATVDTATAEAEFDPLPRAGNAYKAHARFSNKPELMLGLLQNALPLDAFAYGDLRRVRLLEPQTPGGGPVLWLRFVEAEITEVFMEGRNLLTLVEYIQMHRVRWLRECPRGKEPKDPAAAVITRITVKPME